MPSSNIGLDIRSFFLPGEESVLRAIFYPIRMEILRSGKTLTDDEGSFFVPSGFSWRKSIKEFFDTYYAICYRKQIEPSNFDSEYKKAVKIPYIHFDTVIALHQGITSTVRQFRLKDIRPFDKLSSNPSNDEIKECRKEYIKDNDFCQYFTLLLQIDSALREYVQILDELIGAYNVRFGCFRRALRNAKNESELKKSQKEATDKLLKILAPYIKRLKRVGALPSSWAYDIKKLPLSDFHKSTLREDERFRFEKYWSEDTLPLVSFREKIEREAERKRREEEARRAKSVSSYKPSTPKPIRSKPTRVRLSRPSLWHRFDKWVTGIGEGLAYRMDDITDWLMKAAIWIAIIFAAVVVIATLINDGLFVAIIVVLIAAALIGILEWIAGIFAAVVKYVSYIPLYIVRIIFYRGWTFLIVLLSIAGYVVYKVLEMKLIC